MENQFIDDEPDERPATPFDTPPDHLDAFPTSNPEKIPPDEGDDEAHNKGEAVDRG